MTELVEACVGVCMCVWVCVCVCRNTAVPVHRKPWMLTGFVCRTVCKCLNVCFAVAACKVLAYFGTLYTLCICACAREMLVCMQKTCVCVLAVVRWCPLTV